MKQLLGLIVFLLLWMATGCSPHADKTARPLIDQAEALFKTDPKKAYTLLDSISFPEGLSSRQEARWCMLMGKLADSIQTRLPYVFQLQLADKYYMRHGSKSEQAWIKLYLGQAYLDDWNSDMGMQTYSDAFNLAMEAADYDAAGYVCFCMGYLHEYHDNYPEAKEKFLMACDYFEQVHNLHGVALSYFHAAQQYSYMDSIAPAMHYYALADSLMSINGDSVGLSDVYSGYGTLHLQQNDYDKAEHYLNQSIEYHPNAAAYSGLFEVYLKQKKFDEARHALELSQNTKASDPYTHTENIYLEAKLEHAIGNDQKAYEILNLYVDTTYVDYMIKNSSKMVEVEKKYEHSKIALDNAELRKSKGRMIIVHLTTSLLLIIGAMIALVFFGKKKMEVLKVQKRLAILEYLLSKDKEQLGVLHQELKQLKQAGVTREEMSKVFDEKQKETERLNNLLSNQREKLIESAPVMKRLHEFIQTADPNQTKSPILKRDWSAIVELIKLVYPTAIKRISESSLSEAECKLCYLSVLGFDTAAISALLCTPTNTIYKNRQRIKAKLDLPSNKTSLYDFLTELI